MPAVRCTLCHRLLMISTRDHVASDEILCTPCESLSAELREQVRRSAAYDLPTGFTRAANDRSS